MLIKKLVSLVCVFLTTQVNAGPASFVGKGEIALYSQMEAEGSLVADGSVQDDTVEEANTQDITTDERESSSAEVSSNNAYEEVVTNKVSESESDKKLNVFLKGAFVVTNAALFILGYGATKLAPGKRA